VANLPTLILGNRNSSAWSLAAWLCLKKSHAAFLEQGIDLSAPNAAETLAEWSPSGLVPVLVHEGSPIWDSLAIAEYINEVWVAGNLWPKAALQRAEARALACEVHAGFRALTAGLPMNCRTQNLALPDTPELARDIVRIAASWQRALARSSGPWLFGPFSIADAMYAPMVFRFRSHGVRLGDAEHTYMRHVLSDPDVLAWFAAALKEAT